MSPEDPHAGRVKCRYPDALCAVPHDFIHPVTHLARRLIGKCDRQDAPRTHPHIFDQIRDASREHTRLSAARACEDQHWSLRGEDTFFLLFVQCIIKPHFPFSFYSSII